MDIYIAICCDRHIDEVVKVFTTPEKAIAFAKWFAREGAHSLDRIVEEEIEGWLYYAGFSAESDHVRVVKDVLDPDFDE